MAVPPRSSSGEHENPGQLAQATSGVVRTNIDRTINKPITITNQSGGVTNYWTYWASKHPGLVNFGFCDGFVSGR